MKLKYKLLDHPFYKAWNKGLITETQLTKYAKSYLEFIENVPNWWTKISNDFSVHNETIDTIINEETSHIKLWKKWYSELKDVKDFPSSQNLIMKLNSFNSSELLGAVHSFEIQQPEVAKLKKEVLMSCYNIEESKLQYFTEHTQEDEHINYGKFLYENYSNKKDFYIGFFEGSKLIYENLDLFL